MSFWTEVNVSFHVPGIPAEQFAGIGHHGHVGGVEQTPPVDLIGQVWPGRRVMGKAILPRYCFCLSENERMMPPNTSACRKLRIPSISNSWAV